MDTRLDSQPETSRRTWFKTVHRDGRPGREQLWESKPHPDLLKDLCELG